jgi:peptidyl-prolyl cis-trans isomerase C
MKFKAARLFSTFLMILIAAACSGGEVPASVVPTGTNPVKTPEATFQENQTSLTPTALTITETTAPLAATVNGEAILLEDYEVELVLAQDIVGTGLATIEAGVVLEDMIDQVLLAQAAESAGFSVDDDIVQKRIQELGLSDQALRDWMMTYGYSEDGFRRVLERSIAAAWMRDQVISEVPETVEQVHARQILLYNLAEAETVFAQLESGTEFGTLSAEYEPLTKGELGWFPRGYLTVPELDEVLFSLEPGSYSPIIQTSLGFHIVQVLERDSNHPLTADARRVVQLQILDQWLEARRNESDIILFVP